MDNNEDEDGYPALETITPQCKIESNYQSVTEKGIRQVCCELLDLKDAVENLRGTVRSKSLAFLRFGDEVVGAKQELNELRKCISDHGIIVNDIKSGVGCKLDEWKQAVGDIDELHLDSCVLEPPLPMHPDDRETAFLEEVDVLLAEHNMEKAIEVLCAEEKSLLEQSGSGDSVSDKGLSYKSALSRRKAKLEDQIVELANQPAIGIQELEKVMPLLIKIGKGPLAQHHMLKVHRSRLRRKVEFILPLSHSCPKTFPAALSKQVFSTISLTVQKSASIYGDNPVYTNRIVQWAEWEIEGFVRLVKENSPILDSLSALCLASNFVQASLNYCLLLEPQGLKLSTFLLVLSRPYIDEVLELNFRRARRELHIAADVEESFLLSPHSALLTDFVESPDNLLVSSGIRFMEIIEDIISFLTPLMIVHFGANVLLRISQLFGRYMDEMIKSLPGLSDDDNLSELKDDIHFRAETDSEQLALLGTAFTIQDKLLINLIRATWAGKKMSAESVSDTAETDGIVSAELKDWKRQLQLSFDKLKDHFCRQYILSFIYSREGKTRLNAQIYLSNERQDHYWDSDPLPSLPFQALFSKLQQLATVAGDVLLGKEKLQEKLLARLTETVVIWLSDDKEFWSVFEDESIPIALHGLQQLILDMHFTVEIARYAGYLSRQAHQIASAIIARAIRTFEARGVDPQSSLPEDEWYVETAKSAIKKLLLGTSGSESSETNEHHIIVNDEIVSDSDDTVSSLSTMESAASFVSARSTGELDSPTYLTDPEN